MRLYSGILSTTLSLSLLSYTLDDKNNPMVIQVTIKQSKTDIFRQGVDLYLRKTGKNICPVKIIISYLVIRGAKPGPLFIFADGSYLTRQRFASLVASTLQRTGIDDKRYNTRSFCIRAFNIAKEAGISDVHIKMLGMWKSSAYQLYVRTPQNQLARLSE